MSARGLWLGLVYLRIERGAGFVAAVFAPSGHSATAPPGPEWWTTLRDEPRSMVPPPVIIALALSGAPTMAAVSDACPETAHRFERFALQAPALGRAKQIRPDLLPGYDCAPRRRYPVFYFNDGHDLFDWNPFAADLDPGLAAEIARREGVVRQLAPRRPA